MKKRNDRRFLIVGLFAIMAIGSVGYALFAETINVTGTADATGTFDVEFTAATVTNEADSTGASAVIDGTNNTVTLTAGDLQQPGATVTYHITVHNAGNLPANLLSVDVTGDTADADIVLTTPTFPTGVALASNDTYEFDITVTWDAASTTGSKSIAYNVALNYQQV